MNPKTKRRHRLWIPLAISALAIVLSLVSLAIGAHQETAPPPPAAISLPPGAVVMVSVDRTAWLIYSPSDGSLPIVVATFRFGLDVEPEPLPDPTPDPGKISGVMIVENQEDRTVLQASVMDDPQWQAAAKAAGLTWAIEDKDHPRAAPMLEAIKSPLPVVVYVDADGKPVRVVPLPATVEEMRELIGGTK